MKSDSGFTLNGWVRRLKEGLDITNLSIAQATGASTTDVSDWVNQDQHSRKHVPVESALSMARRFSPTEEGFVVRLGKLDATAAGMKNSVSGLANLGLKMSGEKEARSTLIKEIDARAKDLTKHALKLGPAANLDVAVEAWQGYMHGADRACRYVTAAARQNNFDLVNNWNVCEMVHHQVEMFLRYFLDPDLKRVQTDDVTFRQSLRTLQGTLAESVRWSLEHSKKGSDTAYGAWTEIQAAWLIEMYGDKAGKEKLEGIWRTGHLSGRSDNDALRKAGHNLSSHLLRGHGVADAGVLDSGLAQIHLQFDRMHYGGESIDCVADGEPPSALVLDRMLLDMMEDQMACPQSGYVREQEFLALKYATDKFGHRIFADISIPKFQAVAEDNGMEKEMRGWATSMLKSLR